MTQTPPGPPQGQPQQPYNNGQGAPQQPYQNGTYPQGAYQQQGATVPAAPAPKSRKGCWIAAAIVGLVLLLGLGSCLAMGGAAMKSVNSAVASASSASNAVHKITYKATMSGTSKAHVTYSGANGTGTEDITANWTKDAEVTGQYQTVMLTVSNSDYQSQNAATSCEILVDGKSVAKQEGSGSTAMSSCSYTIK